MLFTFSRYKIAQRITYESSKYLKCNPDFIREIGDDDLIMPSQFSPFEEVIYLYLPLFQVAWEIVLVFVVALIITGSEL